MTRLWLASLVRKYSATARPSRRSSREEPTFGRRQSHRPGATPGEQATDEVCNRLRKPHQLVTEANALAHHQLQRPSPSSRDPAEVLLVDDHEHSCYLTSRSMSSLWRRV